MIMYVPKWWWAIYLGVDKVQSALFDSKYSAVNFY
jgi:hypothetical protein